jgi:hypothetical protein
MLSTFDLTTQSLYLRRGGDTRDELFQVALELSGVLDLEEYELFEALGDAKAEVFDVSQTLVNEMCELEHT